MAYINNLSDILTLMGYEMDKHFLVSDNQDGNGPYISYWNHSDEQPSIKDMKKFLREHNKDPQRLEEHKAFVKRQIDLKAGETRQRFITSVTGQFSVYEDKVDEATEYVAAGYPKMGKPPEYPYIDADAEAFGVTHREAANKIIEKRAEWIQICVKIEKLRLKAKRDVDAAKSEKSVNRDRNKVFKKLEELQ